MIAKIILLSLVYKSHIFATSYKLKDGFLEEENLLTDLVSSTSTTSVGNKSNGVEELVISTTFRPMTVADALNLRNNDTSSVSKGIYFDEILTQQ